ncbi:MAG TPA: heparinase II/III family protein [Gemmatimonadaceae bacterium]|nr:heparinase II/III family protein [Gemmatimonadaceae bacterium]
MSLLIGEESLSGRRAAARGALAPLASSLTHDLARVVRADLDVPVDKALLSRDGGRCARDGTPLEFDPFSPASHRCAVCGEIYRGERHDRWWVMSFQLWLAERCVHAALLHALLGDPHHARLAERILERYAELYLEYPNRDNVLGPSRPFFSTYLESIWLLQLCVALDLIESALGPGALGGVVRERLIEPSAQLIASFEEGSSNRQVWNNAALVAANLLLGRRDRASRAVSGASGLVTHLTTGLLPDGTWYEGENYHLFAHRGLWYGVLLAERGGWELPSALVRRFEEGFATPLATALPDFTFPSRRDSQYRVSLRQWRFAESCELGLARRDDGRLRGALWQLYEHPASAGDTGRWRSTADVERNEPPCAFTRADLGWRSLLLARETLPPLAPIAPRSVLLEGQGIAVLRRDGGRVFAALDYGHSGGGHGHPDRLNVMLCVGEERWLDDVGTGSYVDPTLHWYRSTLAHNAPLIDGRSQRPTSGVLRAFDERGGAGWVEAAVSLPAIDSDVTLTRTLVAMPSYVIDRLIWSAECEADVALPVHVLAQVAGVGPWRPGTLTGGSALEDGFGFVHDAGVAAMPAGSVAQLSLAEAEHGRAWIVSDQPLEWWRALGPGTPREAPREREFFLLRARTARGVIATVWSWTDAVCEVSLRGDALVVRTSEGEAHEHRRRPSGWHVDLLAGTARSSIDLGGERDAATEVLDVADEASVRPERRRLRTGERAEFVLGERSYRRSEETWREAGSPEAIVVAGLEATALVLDVSVRKDPLLFRDAAAPDPALDNEHPDIHSDGVQLYVQRDDWPAPAAWLAVPVANSSGVRVREIAGARGGVPIDAAWRTLPTGYAMRFGIPLAALGAERQLQLSLGLVVNDMGPGRLRRRGQLALHAGPGFVYLCGDREDPASFLPLVLVRD